MKNSNMEEKECIYLRKDLDYDKCTNYDRQPYSDFCTCYNCWDLCEYYKDAYDPIDGSEIKYEKLDVPAVELPKYSARITIGDLVINLKDKTFTHEQIKNMHEFLGWEVENLNNE